MDVKEFFEDFRWWFEEAKTSKRFCEYQYRLGRLRGMSHMALQTKVISINTWITLETLLEKLGEVILSKDLDW